MAEAIRIGAIRWDAWTGGDVTAQVVRTLSPGQYQHRLPWFAEVTGPDSARIDGSPQSVMDREIDWAADAGLAYWAFLIYPEAGPMSVALEQYRNSARKSRLKFCAILHGTLGVTDADWPRERERLLTLFTDEQYQTVLGNRPLVYCFIEKNRFPVERFHDLRDAAAALNPYYVWMGWDPVADRRDTAPWGFDAVSHYAIASANQWDQFRQLADAAETNWWERAAREGVPYVPVITTGWDKTPRKDHPVSWENGHAYHHETVFPSMATPDELAAHLARAVAFVEAHPASCAARTGIMYAWNEYDEGGWLAPTRGADGAPDASRLDAVGSVLRKARIRF